MKSLRFIFLFALASIAAFAAPIPAATRVPATSAPSGPGTGTPPAPLVLTPALLRSMALDHEIQSFIASFVGNEAKAHNEAGRAQALRDLALALEDGRIVTVATPVPAPAAKPVTPITVGRGVR